MSVKSGIKHVTLSAQIYEYIIVSQFYTVRDLYNNKTKYSLLDSLKSILIFSNPCQSRQ